MVKHWQLMMAQERWDAALRPGGRVVIAFTVFSGGDYYVEIAGGPGSGPRNDRPPNAPQAPWVLPPDRLRGSTYQGARFVRGLEGRLVVSALLGSAKPVVFSDLQLGEDREEGASSVEINLKCADAILVADREGLGLVCQGWATPRPDPSERFLPGAVGYVRLDANLQPILPVLPLFPAGVVSGFDATPLADGIAVAAATTTGLSVVAVGRRLAGFEVLGRKDVALTGTTRSPSILAASGKLHVAVLEDGGTLVGEVALGP